MSLTIQQMGKQLFQESLKTSSFGSKEKDLEKFYKSKYLIESWKYGTDSNLIGKCYRDVYLEYIKKVREMESVKDTIKNAAFQAREAAIMAKSAVKGQSFNNDYYNALETDLYHMKRSKKRKVRKDSINSFKKKRKYDLTVRTNFNNWSDFTNYVKHEKEKMKEKKTQDKESKH